jgi:hypothetical protein
MCGCLCVGVPTSVCAIGPHRVLCGSSRGTAATGGIYSLIARPASARAAARACVRVCAHGVRVCVCVCVCLCACVCVCVPIGRSRALAAGATWTARTLHAPWAARFGHTSVIDAAGAIYVIGGGIGTNPTPGNYIDFNDVWASTDGGARAGLVRGTRRGYSRGTS